MDKLKIKKRRKASTIIGIAFIVMQGIDILLEYKFGLYAKASYATDHAAIANGISQSTIILGNIIGTIAGFWMLIVGLCLIIIPRLIDNKKAKEELKKEI